MAKNGDIGVNKCSRNYGVPSSDSESSTIDSAVDYIPKEKKIRDILL
jgi:L-lysine 2,3-aminomutase